MNLSKAKKELEKLQRENPEIDYVLNLSIAKGFEIVKKDSLPKEAITQSFDEAQNFVKNYDLKEDYKMRGKI